MITWIRESLSNKVIATIIAGVFLLATFACFTMTTTGGHSGQMGAACETITNLASNTIIQAGTVSLLILAAAWISSGTSIIPTQSELNLSLTKLHRQTQYKQVSSREYSYLSQLFSSGIIHSKLHRIAV